MAETNGSSAEYPGKIWFAVDRKGILIGKKTGKAALTGPIVMAAVKANDKLALCVFTTKEIAATYIEQRKDESLIAISPGSRAELVEFLEDRLAHGYAHIIINPVDKGRLKPMAVAIENAKKGIPP